MTQYDEIYESWMSRLLGPAVAAASLGLGIPGGAMAEPAPNPTTLTANAQAVKSMAIPKDRPKTFESFKKDYMFPIYYNQVMRDASLSNTNETFAGPRFNLYLHKLVQGHESNGKFTPASSKEKYISHDGKKYCQRVPDPAGGDTIGNGVQIKNGSPFSKLLKSMIGNGIAFDAEWKPITSVTNIEDKLEYIEANAMVTLENSVFEVNRTNLIKYLSEKGVDYDKLDAYAKLALEDLAYNVGTSIPYKKMIGHLASNPVDYVKAAYEVCNADDWESFGGLRDRRIDAAHLFLMAAQREGQMDVYMHEFQTKSPTGATVNPNVPNEEGFVNYSVREGDVLSLIAKRYGTTSDAIARDNGMKNKNALTVGQILRIKAHPNENAKVAATLEPIKPNPNANVHIVSNGETLGAIALSNGTTVSAIMKVNPGINANKIRVGQRIVMPTEKQTAEESMYTVKSGDSFSMIAYKHKIPLKTLQSLNKGIDYGKIKPGQKIRIK